MRRAVLSIVATSAILLAPGSAPRAQHDHSFTQPMDPALASRPTTLESGIGQVHQKVSTASEQAQAFYDQGLAHLHSYRWIEAARSFHEALRLDPKLAMAHLGLARAYEGAKDDEASGRALEEARRLVEDATPREKRWVAAYALKRKALHAGEDERDAAQAAYVKALDALVEEDPKDAEAWCARGNASEGPWGRGQGGDESSLPFYEGALRSDPDHFGAHHYIAHTYENVGRPQEAVRHAEIYARACPEVPHARHMFAHTLPRVGRWKDTVAELEAADELEERFAREEGLPTSHDWHRVHNLTLLGLAYLHTGRKEDAERVLREAFETPIPDPLVQSWHSTWPEFLLLQNRPEEAEAAARELASRASPMSRVVGTALAGEARLDQKDPAGAAERSAEARRRVEELGREAASHPRGEALVWVATEYANVLDARRALHANATPEWTTFVAQVGEAIAADPTFDGWGVGWLRLQRLERDARANGHTELAERLKKHLDRLAEPAGA